MKREIIENACYYNKAEMGNVQKKLKLPVRDVLIHHLKRAWPHYLWYRVVETGWQIYATKACFLSLPPDAVTL